MEPGSWEEYLRFMTAVQVYALLIGILLIVLGIGLAGWASSLRAAEKERSKRVDRL